MIATDDATDAAADDGALEATCDVGDVAADAV